MIVEGDWDPADNSIVKLKLQIYFGSAKRSSGGECLVQPADAAPWAALYFSTAAGECGGVGSASPADPSRAETSTNPL